jgi:hypothetical protein
VKLAILTFACRLCAGLADLLEAAFWATIDGDLAPFKMDTHTQVLVRAKDIHVPRRLLWVYETIASSSVKYAIACHCNPPVAWLIGERTCDLVMKCVPAGNDVEVDAAEPSKRIFEQHCLSAQDIAEYRHTVPHELWHGRK